VGIKPDGSISPLSNESAVIETTKESEMDELARKYGVPKPTNEVDKQNKSFDKILNPVDDKKISCQ